MSIEKDLSQLVNNQVITPETAQNIQQYYRSKKPETNNKLVLILGILGSLLVGLGIILILAHNWYNFPKSVRLALGYTPLLIGQALCVYAYFKKANAAVWTESAAIITFFGIAVSISIVSQVYHINGSMSSFLLTWMLLSLPIIYLLKSNILVLFTLVGSTWYGLEYGYYQGDENPPFYYLLLVGATLPWYLKKQVQNNHSNYLTIYHWLFSLSLVMVLGAFHHNLLEYIFPMYFGLFAIFYLWGHNKNFDDKPNYQNPYLVLGTLGTLVCMFILSFDGLWTEMIQSHITYDKVFTSIEFYVSIILSAFAGVLLFTSHQKKDMIKTQPFSWVHFIFLFLFLVSPFSDINFYLVNLIILYIGIQMMMNGFAKDHLGIINFALVIITMLIAFRFFDTDLSFVFRGFAFILIGMAFFAVNYQILKSRK